MQSMNAIWYSYHSALKSLTFQIQDVGHSTNEGWFSYCPSGAHICGYGEWRSRGT
jgi:hypothetical protein